jgi:pyridoxal phosphate phosphatase PHOSPHO2
MLLVVFDFDHTIVDDNSDTYVNQLFPTDEQYRLANNECLHMSCWTDRMRHIFTHLSRYHTTEDDYIRHMQMMPLTDGLARLIVFLHSLKDTQLIIVSDSNSMFIDIVLKHNQLDDRFKNIFTNRAYFDRNEQCLSIEPCGQHTCSTCPLNMCKRAIIETYRQMTCTDDTRIVFIGDGHNDVCAATSLRSCDLVCARRDYRMAKELKNEKLTAELLEWTHGKDIEDFLREHWLPRLAQK